MVDKSVERGWRVAIQVKEAARRDALDAHLWTFREDSFLPHGTDEADGCFQASEGQHTVNIDG